MIKTRIYPIWFVPAIIASLVLLIPFLFLIWQGIFDQSEHWGHITEFLLYDYVINSISILVSVSLLCVTWGVFPAYLVSRFKFPLSNALKWMLTAPLAIPTFIMSIVYSGVFDITGPLASLSVALGAQKPLYLDLLNFWGLSLTLSFALYPYVYLSALIGFTGKSIEYEETAYSLRQSPWSVFWKVSIPMAIPFILSGILLVMMELLNDYGAMKYYGYNTFTTGIFKAWFDLGDLNAAIKLCGVLFIFVLVLLWLKKYASNTETKHQGQMIRKELKGFKAALAFLFCFMIVLFSLIIPGLFIIINGIGVFSDVADSSFWSITIQSIIVAIAASLAIVLISIKFSYTTRIHAFKWIRSMFRINNVGYAIPGAIIAIGVIAIGQFLGVHSGLIIGSLFLLILGYAVRFLSSGYQSVDNALRSNQKEMDETGKLMGLNVNLIFARIHFPQLKPALMAASLFVFIEVMKELPMTLILKPFNFETLATSAFQYATDEMLIKSCVPAMLILILTFIPNFLMHRSMNK